jgi:hypothetical protein
MRLLYLSFLLLPVAAQAQQLAARHSFSIAAGYNNIRIAKPGTGFYFDNAFTKKAGSKGFFIQAQWGAGYSGNFPRRFTYNNRPFTIADVAAFANDGLYGKVKDRQPGSSAFALEKSTQLYAGLLGGYSFFKSGSVQLSIAGGLRAVYMHTAAVYIFNEGYSNGKLVAYTPVNDYYNKLFPAVVATAQLTKSINSKYAIGLTGAYSRDVFGIISRISHARIVQAGLLVVRSW